MKQLIFSLCLLAFGISNAQTVNDIPIKDIDVEYMEIVGVNRGVIAFKLTIDVDFGQHTKNFSNKEKIIKDENGKQMVFESMIDALNFFSKYGYEFETAYAVTEGNQNVYHYLLRKKPTE